MNEIWFYILSANPDEDDVSRDRIPYKLNDKQLFFGPCKKAMRQQLFDQFLAPNKSRCKVNRNIYIVGINGQNGKGKRKIIWIGKLKEVMTFEEAWNTIDPKHRRVPASPLHVKPLYSGDTFIGYGKNGDLHAYPEWLSDLTSRRFHNVRGNAKNAELHLPAGRERSGYFNRDCCMLLDLLHYAEGPDSGVVGIEISKELQRLLSKAQGGRKVEENAPFGRNKGKINGLRGKWLPVIDPVASEMLTEILHDKKALRRSGSGENKKATDLVKC